MGVILCDPETELQVQDDINNRPVRLDPDNNTTTCGNCLDPNSPGHERPVLLTRDNRLARVADCPNCGDPAYSATDPIDLIQVDEYAGLTDAAKLIAVIKLEISKEDGFTYTSPAWSILHHAIHWCNKQADEILRGSPEGPETDPRVIDLR